MILLTIWIITGLIGGYRIFVPPEDKFSNGHFGGLTLAALGGILLFSALFGWGLLGLSFLLQHLDQVESYLDQITIKAQETKNEYLKGLITYKRFRF